MKKFLIATGLMFGGLVQATIYDCGLYIHSSEGIKLESLRYDSKQGVYLHTVGDLDLSIYESPALPQIQIRLGRKSEGYARAVGYDRPRRIDLVYGVGTVGRLTCTKVTDPAGSTNPSPQPECGEGEIFMPGFGCCKVGRCPQW